ncbi:MAG: 4Fe-4S dicluster domain-containing protein [Azoarcus sp.]|jgi:ferredoxin|nr:4Fe-4S dicluster domain-containing protein [Azoarcus sp.]
MALEIVNACIGCHACEPLCPNRAITAVMKSGQPLFAIDANKCTECLGDHELPQCAEICPIEGAIVDEYGEPLNPPGSLTGIPFALFEQIREAECHR